MTTFAEVEQYLHRGGWRGAWMRLRRDRLAVSGLVIVGVLVVLAATAPLIAPHDPIASDMGHRLAAPSADYPLGTDHLGRCLLSRILHGARLSLSISFGVMLVVMALAVVVGTAAGFFGGVLDAVLMRIVDILLAFPSLVLAVAIAGLLGPGLQNAVVAIVLVWWAGYARIIRGIVASVRSRPYVEAARAAGGTTFSVVRVHVLPNVLSPIIVLATLDVAVMVLALASLSYLGLGAQPPQPEWGRMLYDARPYLERAPLQTILPGAAIAVAALGFNLVGDGLRDALDPRMGRF